jgi:hypothetical protein
VKAVDPELEESPVERWRALPDDERPGHFQGLGRAEAQDLFFSLPTWDQAELL